MAASTRPYHPAFAFPGVVAVLSLLAGHALSRAAALQDWRFGTIAAIGGIVTLLTSNRQGSTFVAGFCILFAGIGIAQQSNLTAYDKAAFNIIESQTGNNSRNFTVRGRVAVSPQRTRTGWLIYLAQDTMIRGRGAPVQVGGMIAASVRAETMGDGSIPVIGDVVEATGELRELSHVPGAGDPGNWMRARGAVAQLFVSHGKPFTLQPSSSRSSQLLRLSAQASVSCERAIRAALPEPQAALLMSLTIGKTHLLSDEQRTSFRRTGLLHLFSVSGLHTMLVGGILVWLLRVLGFRPWIRFAVMIAALAFFATLVGMASPVIRAALLLILYESRQLLRRPIEPLSALGSVATILLLLSPRLPYQVDFQMTFLCAVALVLMAQWSVALKMAVGRRLGWGWRSRIVSDSLQLFVASCVIQVILIPIYANQFGEVSLISPIANMLLLQLASLLVIAGFVSLAFIPIMPFLAIPSLALLKWPLGLLEWGTAILAKPDFVVMALPNWSLFMTGTLYLLLTCSAFVRFHGQRSPRRSPWRFVPVAMAVAMLLCAQPFLARGDGKLHVWFLDVGQGDATLVQFPDRSTLLVDAGPQRTARELPAMIRSRGVQRLNSVIATHADADHIGGMNEVLEAIPADILLVGGSLAETNQFRDLESTVREKYIPVATALRGGEFTNSDGHVRVTFLHPTSEFSSNASETNKASVVTRIDFAGRSILLMGDAGWEAEWSMIHDSQHLAADVLKLGHHGSNTSSSDLLVDEVRPTIAIISCGKNNSYRHPSFEVLDRLKERSITTYRTDNDGTIHLSVEPTGEIHVEATRLAGESLR
ncbi:DNA internalization-related competence protein ComEC/Rec2 [Candidatus Sumerlaeota bacterium]|nr:DNA internalization-related competence protein ComEC/Rec2 [Candidatus Sumerlaeota bacterium]